MLDNIADDESMEMSYPKIDMSLDDSDDTRGGLKKPATMQEIRQRLPREKLARHHTTNLDQTNLGNTLNESQEVLNLFINYES